MCVKAWICEGSRCFEGAANSPGRETSLHWVCERMVRGGAGELGPGLGVRS